MGALRYDKGNHFAVRNTSFHSMFCVQFLERATSIENPILLYDPILEREVDSYNGNPICVLGVDILPSELPKESSAHFGTALAGVIKQLLYAKEQQGSFSNGIDPSLLSSGVVSFFMQLCLTMFFSLTPLVGFMG